MDKVMELDIKQTQKMAAELTVEEKIESCERILDITSRIEKMLNDPNSYLDIDDENK